MGSFDKSDRVATVMVLCCQSFICLSSGIYRMGVNVSLPMLRQGNPLIKALNKLLTVDADAGLSGGEWFG